MSNRKVHLPGHGTFWLINGDALAPLEHCDEDGELIFPECLAGESYAHIFGKEILRHRVVIGHESDLENA